MMRRAFTLLELLVAIGMLVLLAGALGLFLDDLATTRAHSSRIAAQTRSADALFGAIESAVQTAVVDGGALGAGVRGGGAQLRLLSSRTDAGVGSIRQLARAAFAPLSETQIDASSGAIRVRRGGAETTLPAPVRWMQVRFLGADGWLEEFDSLQDGVLPRAIEVSLWFGVRTADASKAATALEAASPEAASLETPQLEPAPLEPADRVRMFAVPDAGGTP